VNKIKFSPFVIFFTFKEEQGASAPKCAPDWSKAIDCANCAKHTQFL